MYCKRVSGILLVLGVTVLVGCGSQVQFVPVDATIYEPRSDDHHILVYTSAVHQPHVVLGSITVEKKLDASYGGSSSFDLMVLMLQEEARRVGGDALVNVHPVSTNEHMDTTVILRAQVIRYLDRQRFLRAK